jgi:hypothetical protein
MRPAERSGGGTAAVSRVFAQLSTDRTHSRRDESCQLSPHGAPTNPELTLTPDHSSGADH